MKKARLGLVIALAGLSALLASLAPRHEASGQDDEEDKVAKEALEKAIEQGKKLFHDASLGTKEKSCSGCHEDPKRPKLSLADRANTYPKYDRRNKKVITLGQKIDQMIVRMLKGTSESQGSERLVAIEAYLMSISRDR